jgi:hypothetical protein
VTATDVTVQWVAVPDLTSQTLTIDGTVVTPGPTATDWQFTIPTPLVKSSTKREYVIWLRHANVAGAGPTTEVRAPVYFYPPTNVMTRRDTSYTYTQKNNDRLVVATAGGPTIRLVAGAFSEPTPDELARGGVYSSFVMSWNTDQNHLDAVAPRYYVRQWKYDVLRPLTTIEKEWWVDCEPQWATTLDPKYIGHQTTVVAENGYPVWLTVDTSFTQLSSVFSQRSLLTVNRVLNAGSYTYSVAWTPPVDGPPVAGYQLEFSNSVFAVPAIVEDHATSATTNTITATLPVQYGKVTVQPFFTFPIGGNLGAKSTEFTPLPP